MALTILEQNTINRGLAAAKLLLEQLRPILDELNVIYDGTGGVKSTITQQNLDSAAYLSGLTVAQLNDGFFVLTATVRADLDNGLTALSQLAARSTTSQIS